MAYTFNRSCPNCGLYFWNADSEVKFCGDKDCSKEELSYKTYLPHNRNISYSEIFESFNSFFTKNKAFCEQSIVLNRCSTNTKVSSTNMNFITAGISTYETLLDSENPRLKFFSNKLLISTPFVFRFNDLENVGLTKRHNTGFFMFSLHCFEDINKRFPPDWETQFLELFVNFYLFLGVPIEKMYLHKDHWSDGVNSGNCVEMFINGQEIGNMVFISEKEGKKRDLKLLDVGLGGERTHNLISGNNLYSKDIIKDHLRSLIIAFKDNLYPGKTGFSYSLRKILEYLFKEGYENTESIKVIADPILNDLSSCLKDNTYDSSFYKTYDYVCKKENIRYHKYTKK